MKNMILAAVVLFASAGTALACVGTTEYPQAVETLKSLTMEAEKKAALMNQILEGKKLHDKAHSTNNMSMMGQSVGILNSLKSQIK